MDGDVGLTIQKIRMERGMTQEQLAEKAGLNRVTIAKYEIGRVSPTAKNLGRLAKALGVTTDYMLHPDEEVPVPLNLSEFTIYARGMKHDITEEQKRRMLDTLRVAFPDFFE